MKCKFKGQQHPICASRKVQQEEECPCQRAHIQEHQVRSEGSKHTYFVGAPDVVPVEVGAVGAVGRVGPPEGMLDAVGRVGPPEGIPEEVPGNSTRTTAGSRCKVDFPLVGQPDVGACSGPVEACMCTNQVRHRGAAKHSSQHVSDLLVRSNSHTTRQMLFEVSHGPPVHSVDDWQPT